MTRAGRTTADGALPAAVVAGGRRVRGRALAAAAAAAEPGPALRRSPTCKNTAGEGLVRPLLNDWWCRGGDPAATGE